LQIKAINIIINIITLFSDRRNDTGKAEAGQIRSITL